MSNLLYGNQSQDRPSPKKRLRGEIVRMNAVEVAERHQDIATISYCLGLVRADIEENRKAKKINSALKKLSVPKLDRERLIAYTELLFKEHQNRSILEIINHLNLEQSLLRKRLETLAKAAFADKDL
jgi:hypothetical protein